MIYYFLWSYLSLCIIRVYKTRIYNMRNIINLCLKFMGLEFSRHGNKHTEPFQSHFRLFFITSSTKMWDEIHFNVNICQQLSVIFRYPLLFSKLGRRSTWSKICDCGFFKSAIPHLKVLRNPTACWVLLIYVYVYITYLLSFRYGFEPHIL